MDSTTEEILEAIGRLDEKTLKDTLAYLLKVYVIDHGISYDKGIKADTDTAAPRQTVNVPATFAELITGLKQEYPMDELKRFSVEDDIVFVTLDGRKLRLSETRSGEPGERVTENKQISPTKTTRPGGNGTASNSRFEKLELD
jgi:hypothetical protein